MGAGCGAAGAIRASARVALEVSERSVAREAGEDEGTGVASAVRRAAGAVESPYITAESIPVP